MTQEIKPMLPVNLKGLEKVAESLVEGKGKAEQNQVSGGENKKTTSQVSEKVTYCEHPVYGIAKYLKSKGYKIHESDERGITVCKRKNMFLGIKGYFLAGRLIFLQDKKWRLDVYGRENIEELEEIAKEFSKEYNVGIDMELEREKF